MANTAALHALLALGVDATRLRDDPDFVEWRDNHKRLSVDGETLFLRGGDHLADEDQMLLEWVRRSRAEATEPIQPLADEFLDIEGGSE